MISPSVLVQDESWAMMSDEKKYDIFLSYNSLDHAHVERVAKELKARKCSFFIDRWYLTPGHDWVEALERALQASRSVAVFLGPHEMGRWQQRERAWALDRAAETGDENFRVIPVLLPGGEPPLGFLKQRTWIDLREDPTNKVQLDALAAAIRGDQVDLDGQPEPRAMICPYRGLLAFREEDSEFFFGRKKYTDDLVGLVRQHSMVAVTGASGSGKSSVVRAGLVPRLRQRGDGKVWDIVTMFPKENPLHSLADVFLPVVEPKLSGVDLIRKRKSLAEDLEHSQVPLWDLAIEGLRQQQGTDRLLLVVDQWEELYTSCKNDNQRHRFIQELLDATSRSESPLSVVFTIRWDFYDQILTNRPLLDRLQHSRLDLGPMNRDELRSAIEDPAKKVELTFQDGLVDRILKEAGEEPGNLPLLEFALEELWKRRDGVKLTHAGYENLGRHSGQKDEAAQTDKGGPLSRAIATYAEGVYQHLTPDEQQFVPALFRKLVRAGAKTEDDTRRRVGLTALNETTRRVVRTLVDKRLLVTKGLGVEQTLSENKNRDDDTKVPARDKSNREQAASTTVEVAHEELLRRWGRLKEWVNEDRQFLLWRSRIDLKSEEFQRDGRAALLRGRSLREAKRFYPARKTDLEENQCHVLETSLKADRRRRVGIWSSVCLAIFVLAAIGLGWYRYDLRQEAENEQRKADNLVESLLATPAGAVEFYLQQLQPYSDLAIPTLEGALNDPERKQSQRAHAAYALIQLGSINSKELKFLLDCVPKLPKDEGVNLIRALASVHGATPLDEELDQRVDQASSDSERNRFLVVQLNLGITDKAASVCELKSDPKSRTSLMLAFKEFPGDLMSLVQTLESTEDPDLRSALCAAIGTIGTDGSEATQPALKRLFVDAPDGGTHSAADWALRQQGLDQEYMLELVQTARSDSAELRDTRDWEINKLHMTMLKIPAREFAIGHVDDQVNPTADAPLEQFKSFWMSDREVSVGQFYAVFKKARSKLDSANPNLPMSKVSWFDAVEFCNELSKQEEMAPYYNIADIERNEDGFIESAVVTMAGGTGYRLPTGKEWEYGYRVLSITDYNFGSDESYLNEFAVFGKNKANTCGTKMPNGWGLFDMHGNVWEWCWDEYDSDSVSRVLRGGSFYNLSQFVTSAFFAGGTPDLRSSYYGFRVSRTP